MKWLRRPSSRAGSDSVVVIGVVAPSGSGGANARGDAHWTLRVDLASWRREGSEIVDEELRLAEALTQEALRARMADLRAYDIVRLEVVFDEEPHRGRLIRVLATGWDEDADLTNRAAQLQVPVSQDIEGIGTVVLDRRIGWWEARVSWLDRPITLTLDGRSEQDLRLAAGHARVLLSDAATWNASARQTAVTHLLHLAEDWAEQADEDPPLEVSESSFLAAITLGSITVRPDGEVEFWYDDGDLFWGHSICVDGSVQEGLREACIHG